VDEWLDGARVEEQLVSRISRRVALAHGTAIDDLIVTGLGEVARYLGADAAVLLETRDDDGIAFTHSWFDQALGPVPFRSDTKAASYEWLRTRLRRRGAQVIDMEELAVRNGPPSVGARTVRFLGVVPTYAGDTIVGAICFYFRSELPGATPTYLQRFAVLADVLIGAVRRRDADVALRESEARCRSILESAIAGIWTVTPDWRISFANDKIAAMLGWTAAELQGRHLLEFIPDTARSRIGDAMERRARSVSEVIDMQYQHRNGSIREVRVAASPLLDARGTFTGALAWVVDVPHETRLQAELATARRLEAVGQLAGGVAHDINNALTVVLAHAQLGERATTGATRKPFEQIGAAAQHAADIARELLAYARRGPAEPRPIDVSALVTSLLPTLDEIVGPKIATVIEPAEHCVVLGDQVQLERVLINLAANARDAMADGGTLGIVLHSERAGDQVSIVVTDTGHGMAPDVVARAFELFFTTKAEHEGLGLAMAYGVVQQLGGSIRIDSRVGAGTTVTILLPLARSGRELDLA
jgi:PAS domain S-box-containing protein